MLFECHELEGPFSADCTKAHSARYWTDPGIEPRDPRTQVQRVNQLANLCGII